METDPLICPEDNVPLALLNLLDRKTRREKWLCARCNKIYLGKKVPKKRRRKQRDK